MFLSKLFDQTHFQSFAPDMTAREREDAIQRILEMIETTGIEVTHRITDEGIEFGFTDPKQADLLRLNLMAMEGDFGAHTHTEIFDNAADRDEWRALATEVSTALGIPFDGYVFDDRLEMDFERSADAIIFREAMQIAWNEGARFGIAHGRGMQHRMANLVADLHGGPGL